MTPGTHRFVALDAMRGLCAVFVCLFHFRVNSPVATSRFVLSSWQFVDFFFVLSGFVIAANYRDRLRDGLPRWRFIALRVGRIYPLHVAVLALFVVTEIAGAAFVHSTGMRPMFDAAHAPGAIPLHLLMLQSVGLVPRLTWNDPAWSIAVEFWAYVGFALLVPVSRDRLDRILIAIALACPLILFAVTPFGINVTWDWALVRCFYGFALGALCWTVWTRTGRAPPTHTGVWLVVELATIVALVGFVMVTGSSRWNLLGPPLFAGAVLVFAHERGPVSRLLSTPPMLFLGTLSYSIYMMHSYVQARGEDVLKLVERQSGIPLTTTVVRHGVPATLAGATPAQGTILVVVMLLVVIGVSYITYRVIELPGQRWSRARFRPTAAARPVSVA